MTPGGPHPDDQAEPHSQTVDRDPLSHLLAGPSAEDRARLRADLLRRAALARANGWDAYRGVWSTGEVIGVAALLGAHAELTALGETVQSTWERWAFDLWGLARGQADVDNGCEDTREWFLDAAYEFASDDAELSGEDIPMSELLAADSGHDIDFEPKRHRELASDGALSEQLSRAAESQTVRRARSRRSSNSDGKGDAK